MVLASARLIKDLSDNIDSICKITRKHGQYHILEDEALGAPEALAGKLHQRESGAVISS